MPAMHITKENFDTEVLNASVPVLVDFWAPWCGPCKMVGPGIDALADEFSGKAKVVKVNVDEEGELALRYGVMSIPTVLLFQNGEIKDKSVGAAAKSFYADMITKLL